MSRRLRTIPRVMTIAGSDSGGGAGIQADLKTFGANGVYGTSVITAVTAQNTIGVQAIAGLSLDIIEAQIDAILTDIGTDAVKIGMLVNVDIINLVADKIVEYSLDNIVLDPVMIAKGGEKLISDNSIKNLKKFLIPLCTLVTPNIPEAEVLTGYSILSKDDMIKAAKKIINIGAENVLLKGGHLKNEMIFDILVSKKKIKVFTKKKIKTRHTHGTGCTLSSALATCLSQKKKIYKSCKISLKYVDKAILTAPGYGKGFGPLNHLVSFHLRNTND